jgi:phosphoglycerate dehydrogenase-like enzyme
MTQKASNLKIAVIGLGNIGQVVAANLVKGNRPVIVAGRTLSKTRSSPANWVSLRRHQPSPTLSKKPISLFCRYISML